MKLARVPRSCPHQDCPSQVPGTRPRITRHATVRTRTRKVPRFLCGACRRTFTASAGTPYHRLRVRRDEFDRAIAMSVEGMSTSSIARALGVAWNTADRWLARAADAATRVSDAAMRNVDAGEVQADELRTFVESKEHTAWVYTSIEAGSRLWLSLRVGRRTLRNTRLHFRDMRARCRVGPEPILIVSDGFKYNRDCVERAFGPSCVYVQVKKRIEGGVIRHHASKLLLGQRWRLERALERGQGSLRPNTSYVERLNLLLRRCCAYLQRKTWSHARSLRRLWAQLELLRCHYNFVRPHSSLRCGRIRRTPAQAAGLAKRPLSLREVFLWGSVAAAAVPLLFGPRLGAALPARESLGFP